MNKKVELIDLNLVDYKIAWDFQQNIHNLLKSLKRNEKKDVDVSQSLILCEHPPVYTLGRSGKLANLLLSEDDLDKKGFKFYKINRGGDITYHGPGQLVVYPILDLDNFFHDVHLYVRKLEEVVIQVLQKFDINAIRVKQFTGVWLPSTTDKPLRKICAIGVHMSRWVTLHGLALNVNTDLNHFKGIIPCGISEDNMTVTSMQSELGAEVEMKYLKQIIGEVFEKVFEFNLKIGE